MRTQLRWATPWLVLLALAFNGLAPALAACLAVRPALPAAVPSPPAAPEKEHACSCPVGPTGTVVSCCCKHGGDANSCRIGRAPCGGAAPVAGLNVPPRQPANLARRTYLARPNQVRRSLAPTPSTVRGGAAAPLTPPPQA